jgi:hypothetical protein
MTTPFHRGFLTATLTAAVAVSLLSGCQREQPDRVPQSTAPATTPPPGTQTMIDVVGGDFPELMADDHPTTPASGAHANADPCAGMHAKRIADMDARWSGAIAQIALECGRDQDEETPNLTVKATLRADTVVMFGIPVTEVHVSTSGYGDTRQYVLAGSFQQQGKALLAKILDSCRARTKQPCEDALAESDTSYYLQTSEIGGIRLDADENNPQQIVYSEISGE